MPEEIELYRKEQLEDMVCTMYGGRAAEEIFIGKITTGAQNDLQRATIICRNYVGIFGMSKEFGIAAGLDYSNPYVGERRALYSNETAKKFDNLVEKLSNEQYEKTKELLKSKSAEIQKLVEVLLKKEVIEFDELTEILGKSASEEKPWMKEYREDLNKKHVTASMKAKAKEEALKQKAKEEETKEEESDDSDKDVDNSNNKNIENK